MLEYRRYCPPRFSHYFQDFCVQREFRRRFGDLFFDKLRFEKNPFAFHPATRLSEYFQGGSIAEIDADFFQHAQCGRMNPLRFFFCKVLEIIHKVSPFIRF